MDDYYYDYDDHNYDAYHDDLLEEDFPSPQQTLIACVLPSCMQILKYIRILLQWNILYIITTQIGKHRFPSFVSIY